MGGNCHGCDRGTVIHALGEIKGFVAGIVVIGELPCGALDLDAVQIAGGDQTLRSHMTGETAGSADLAPLAIVMTYIPGGKSHQGECRDHKDQIHGIEEKHGLFPFRSESVSVKEQESESVLGPTLAVTLG